MKGPIPRFPLREVQLEQRQRLFPQIGHVSPHIGKHLLSFLGLPLWQF